MAGRGRRTAVHIDTQSDCFLAEHIDNLDRIVQRVENPAKRAFDELLDVGIDRGKALASRVKRQYTASERGQVVGSIEAKLEAVLRQHFRRLTSAFLKVAASK